MSRKSITVVDSEDMDIEALKQEVYLLTDDDSMMSWDNKKVLAWRGDLFELTDEQKREARHLVRKYHGLPIHISSISDKHLKDVDDLLAILRSLDLDLDRVLSHGVATADAYGRPDDLLWLEEEKGVVFLTMEFINTETEVYVPEGYETPDGERGPIDVPWGVQIMTGIAFDLDKAAEELSALQPGPKMDRHYGRLEETEADPDYETLEEAIRLGEEILARKKR